MQTEPLEAHSHDESRSCCLKLKISPAFFAFAEFHLFGWGKTNIDTAITKQGPPFLCCEVTVLSFAPWYCIQWNLIWFDLFLDSRSFLLIFFPMQMTNWAEDNGSVKLPSRSQHQLVERIVFSEREQKKSKTQQINKKKRKHQRNQGTSQRQKEMKADRNHPLLQL